MVEELYMASQYREKVILTLLDGEKLIGVPQIPNSPNRIKLQTLEGPIWIPLDDIHNVKRLVISH